MQQSIQTIIARLCGRVNAHEYQIQELKFIDDIVLKGPWVTFSSSAHYCRSKWKFYFETWKFHPVLIKH